MVWTKTGTADFHGSQGTSTESVEVSRLTARVLDLEDKLEAREAQLKALMAQESGYEEERAAWAEKDKGRVMTINALREQLRKALGAPPDMQAEIDGYQNRIAQLEKQVYKLEGSVAENRVKADPASPTSRAGSKSAPRAAPTESYPLVDRIIKAWSKADPNATGFAPRIDLRKQVDTFLSEDSKVQALSDHIKGLESMIVSKEDFVALVKEWAKGGTPPPSKGPPGKGPPGKGPPGKGPPVEKMDVVQLRQELSKQMRALYKKADPEGVGLVKRHEMIREIESTNGLLSKCPELKSLSARLSKLDTRVDIEEFQKEVTQWAEKQSADTLKVAVSA